jgi:hypothetical protein
MNLFIYVEGQEEELFVNRVLRQHLRAFGVAVQRPILAATSFRIGDGLEGKVTIGGVTNYPAIRDDIRNLFACGSVGTDDVLTTLIELYGLPRSFPGHEAALAQGANGRVKAAIIEEAWRVDLGRPNFLPYIQVHEFEALILSRPSVLAEFYPEHAAGIERLRVECAAFRTPEDINETKATSPSHRILACVPTYQKIDGFRHLQDIGVPDLKAHCPGFKAWLDRCEGLDR